MRSVQGTRLLAAVLGLVVAAAGGGDARAATQAQITKCVGDCDVQKRSCIDNSCAPQCCLIGSFFCKTSCVNTCYDECVDKQGTCYDACADLAAGFDFDPIARLSPNRREVRITGPLECGEGLVADISATYTESVGGTTAEGATRVRCSGDKESFALEARISTHPVRRPNREALRLQPGTGRVCGVIRVGPRGTSTAARQWCADLLVVEHEVELVDE